MIATYDIVQQHGLPDIQAGTIPASVSNVDVEVIVTGLVVDPHSDLTRSYTVPLADLLQNVIHQASSAQASDHHIYKSI